MTKFNQTLSTVRHAQSSLTELRVAIEQFSASTDMHSLAEHWMNISSIVNTVQYDLNDIREDKIKELEVL